MHSKALQNRQPPALTVLFLTEMWERFGFYLVQVLLIFYLTNVYNYSDKFSDSILGAFTAFSYITPVLGGYLADRYLGFKHSVVLGGIILSIGYALLSMQQGNLFYLALAMIAVGTGFFKPNISSYLGNFYSQNDDRRERGFVIFYIGINLGITLATVSSGYILNLFGWRANFLIASVGLIFGIATFLIGLKTLEKRGLLKLAQQLPKKSNSKFSLSIIYIFTLVSIYSLSLLIQNPAIADTAFLIAAIGMVLTVFILALRVGGQPSRAMIACLILILFSSLFWAMYYQLFFALNLFIDRVLDRTIFGYQLPSPLFISLESIFILGFGPMLGFLWQMLERKKSNPSYAIKFSLSLFFTAAGLFLLAMGTHFLNIAGLVSPFWVIAAYFLFTLGELFISPVCIAMVTKLVPSRYVGIMMGVYLSGIGFGAKLAGVIAGMAAIPKSMHDTATMAAIYGDAFLIYTKIALVSGLLILLFSPVFNWLVNAKEKRSMVSLADDLEVEVNHS